MYSDIWQRVSYLMLDWHDSLSYLFWEFGFLRSLIISVVYMGTVSSNLRGRMTQVGDAGGGIVSYSYSSDPMRVNRPMENYARSSKAAERTICVAHGLFIVGFCTRAPPRKRVRYTTGTAVVCNKLDSHARCTLLRLKE